MQFWLPQDQPPIVRYCGGCGGLFDVMHAPMSGRFPPKKILEFRMARIVAPAPSGFDELVTVNGGDGIGWKYH